MTTFLAKLERWITLFISFWLYCYCEMYLVKMGYDEEARLKFWEGLLEEFVVENRRQEIYVKEIVTWAKTLGVDK